MTAAPTPDTVRYGRVLMPAAWLVAAAAVATAVTVLVAKGTRPWGSMGPVLMDKPGDAGPYIFMGALTTLFLVIATRLARREPHNSLARWTAVFAFAAAGVLVTDLASSYLLSFRPVSDPALALRLLSSLWLGIAWSAMIVVLLRFPTGRRLSRWWLPVETLAFLGAALLSLTVFSPDNTDIEPFTSPFADWPLAEVAGIGFFGWTLLSLAVPFGGLAIVVRAVRARGDERQQLKWVGFGLLFGWGGAFVISVLTGTGEDGASPGPLADNELAVRLGELAMPFFIFAMPAAMLVAMFRYRLWDIDRLIRRTAVYVVVVGILAAVYVSIVLGIGVGVLGRSGDGELGADAGPVPVALATLVAVALFRPLQRRVLRVIDRRFNRRRAESLERIDEFHDSLRDQTDLANISEGVADTAAEALEPTTVSVWIAPGVLERPRTASEVHA